MSGTVQTMSASDLQKVESETLQKMRCLGNEFCVGWKMCCFEIGRLLNLVELEALNFMRFKRIEA